jgi:cytochrome c553
MQTQKIACPSCGAGLRLNASVAPGTRIKCPKCSVGFSLPDEDEEPAAAVTTARSRKPAPARDEDEDEAPRPRKPRKKQKKAASNLPLILGLVGLGVLVLGGGGVALALAFWPKKTDSTAGNLAGQFNPRTGPGFGPNGPGPFGPGPGGPGSGPGTGGDNKLPDAGKFSAGQKVYVANNCGRCHAIGGGRSRGPDLTHVGGKRTADWLSDHIRDPKSHNPTSRMPPYEAKIQGQDLRDLAEYLASLK